MAQKSCGDASKISQIMMMCLIWRWGNWPRITGGLNGVAVIIS